MKISFVLKTEGKGIKLHHQTPCFVVSLSIHTAVSTKDVQKSVKAYATMPKGSLENTQ